MQAPNSGPIENPPFRAVPGSAPATGPRAPVSVFALAAPLAFLFFLSFALVLGGKKPRGISKDVPIYSLDASTAEAEEPRRIVRNVAGVSLLLSHAEIPGGGRCLLTLHNRADLAVLTEIVPCTQSIHEFALPGSTQEGRYTIRLARESGEPLHLYRFEYVPVD